MTKVTLSIRKTIEQTAEAYFSTAKKAKRKREGTLKTIERFKKEAPVSAQATAPVTQRKRDWYESFRWSFTSDGTLLIGGRDASTNETLIKNRLEPTDTVLHTESPASPFVIVKGAANEERLAQAAQFCAVYSGAWKAGLATTDVFWVKPEQLSKTPNAGEYLSKGGFIVRGEKHFLKPSLLLAVGIIDNRLTAGVPALFIAKGVSYALLEPGKDKPSAIAPKLIKKLGGTPDEWIRILPAGGCTITGWKRVAAQAVT